MYKNNLKKVIDYLEGRLDIYDGKHQAVIDSWDDLWDEMRFLGYQPDDATSIKSYIRNEL